MHIKKKDGQISSRTYNRFTVKTPMFPLPMASQKYQKINPMKHQSSYFQFQFLPITCFNVLQFILMMSKIPFHTLAKKKSLPSSSTHHYLSSRDKAVHQSATNFSSWFAKNGRAQSGPHKLHIQWKVFLFLFNLVENQDISS